ncbi:hypothetical protein K438DRAFT_1726697 [Mycena galopus ATCC 62051]|nr:hypothetical protein K438DRAFT_1726697 [Mycena galopus ATCC 62051]
MPPKNRPQSSTPDTRRGPTQQCLTLLEDEMTRCPDPPTDGYPIARCRVHHEQYRTMTKRYKEAQKFVDDTFSSSLIPTKEDILDYTSVSTILEKARMMKQYVNAIREERAGREIHHGRFFMKVDSGHKMRLNILAKQMTHGVEIRDALEARAMALHLQDHPAKDWVEEFQKAPFEHEDLDEDDGIQPDQDLFSYIRSKEDRVREHAALNEQDDLIALRMRFEREKILQFFEIFLEPETFWLNRFRSEGKPEKIVELRNNISLNTNAWLQYLRRIIFHNPQLLARSRDKVSLKDFIMDEDFGIDDMLQIGSMLKKRLHIGLRWWKDSWTEAVAMKGNPDAAANMGNIENRFKILGGWIYNSSRETPASNKVWYNILSADMPEQDTENRYVRLCSNFDELHRFLSFSAFGMSPTPRWCTKSFGGKDGLRDSQATRVHLSLCGVVLADLVNGIQEAKEFKAKHSGPVPSTLPAKTSGCITWVEMETRAYMFGAIRNQPDDFSLTFLRELRARPDLFAVVTRSETDPPLKVESFGTVTDQIRFRKFEAPFQPVESAPAGRGTWEVVRSAVNILYGGGQGPAKEMTGLLSPAYNNTLGEGGRKEVSLFYHKRFPVKYFLILSASPAMNIHTLARQVAWAAFRANGLVQGNYDENKYNKASDVLFTKHARERLSFLPEGSFSIAHLASKH